MALRVGLARGMTRAGQVASRRPFSTTVADGGLTALSVGELKQLLSERGVDYRDCLEKADLAKRLSESSGQTKGPSSRPTSLTPGELQTVETFQRVSPSVAFIQTTQVMREAPLSLRAMEVPAGTGSGFLWDDKGHVV